MGSTMPSWVAYMRDHGVLAPAAAERIFAVDREHDRGDLSYPDFVVKVVNTYAAEMKGIDVSAVAALSTAFGRKDLVNILPFVAPLFRTLRAAGIEPVIVTGSPREAVVGQFATLGVTTIYATDIATDHGVFTGQVLRNVATGETKQGIADGYQTCDVVLAAGDSVSDLPLLNAARLRIVVDNRSLLAPNANTLHLTTTDSADLLIGQVNTFLRGRLTVAPKTVLGDGTTGPGIA